MELALLLALLAVVVFSACHFIQGIRHMSAITDLTTNVAALTAASEALTAAVTTATGDDPAVVAANTAIQGVTASLQAAVNALTPVAPASGS